MGMYSLNFAWGRVLAYIEDRLGTGVSVWFENIEVLGMGDGKLLLYSPSESHKNVIACMCVKHIQNALKEQFGLDIFVIVFDDMSSRELPNNLCSRLDMDNDIKLALGMSEVDGMTVPTPQMIIKKVCEFYALDEVLLLDKNGMKEAAEANQVAAYLIRKMTTLSLVDIGKVIFRNRSTIVRGIRKVEMELQKGNGTLKNTICDIVSSI